MLKLYKRIDGQLHYHEAWAHDRTIVEHWGQVGERGQTKKHPLKWLGNPAKAVLSVLKSARECGYEPIEADDLAMLCIEFSVDGFGTPADLDKRHSLEKRMDEALGWTGLGHCDGGDIGSGAMEVCCLVVDFEVAKRVISADLFSTPYSDFTRIYQPLEDG